MGAIRYPDLYRCGVAYVAVTDPRLLFANNWQNDYTREMREFSTAVDGRRPGQGCRAC